MCYVHIPKEKRNKLDEKAKRGVFVGYSTKFKGYKVFLLDEEKVEISRDVAFEEDKKWDWIRRVEIKKKITIPVCTSQQEEEERKIISSPVKISLNDQGIDQGGEESYIDHGGQESSAPPKKYKSMAEIMQTAPMVELDETESCFVVSDEPQSYDDACGIKECH